MFHRDHLSVTSAVKRRVNRFQHIARMTEHVVIPEAEHTIALAFQPSCSLAVANQALALGMLRTVNLDDEMRRQAGEVDYVISQRDLTAEVSAARLKAAQVAPENGFGVGRIVAQPPRCRPLESADRRPTWHRKSPHPAAVGGDPPPPGEGEER
jgi:hypothetical protein